MRYADDCRACGCSKTAHVIDPATGDVEIGCPSHPDEGGCSGYLPDGVDLADVVRTIGDLRRRIDSLERRA